MSDTPSPAASPAPQPSKRRRWFLGGMAAGGLLGGLLATAFSVHSHSGHGPGWMGRHGGLCGEWHRADPQARVERAEFAADWALSRVGASDEQKQQVRSVMQAAFRDMGQLRDQHCANREGLIQALQQPKVDRAALEDLRRKELALAEQGSARLADAVTEAANALTPEQRVKLVELAQRMRGGPPPFMDRPGAQ